MCTLKQLLEENVGRLFPSATFSIITPNDIQSDFVGDTSINKLYDLASLTKVIVTNTLIGLAVQDNKISLDDKLSDFLYEYKYLDKINGISSLVTIKELLIHQSALKIKNIKNELTSIYKQGYELASKTAKQNINSIEVDLDLVDIKDGKVIKKIQYANINFILLQKIIEKIYNKPLDVLAKEKIFEPLNMEHTHFNEINKAVDASKYIATEQTEYRGLIKGYVHDENAFFLGGIAGHAGLFSNINDVSKFAQMILRNGNNNEEYISKAIISNWFKPYNSKRTIGWEFYKHNVIKHTGFTGTMIYINKNKNIAVSILTNRINYGRENIGIYDLFDEIYKMYL